MVHGYVKPGDIAKRELKIFELCCRHEKKVHIAEDVWEEGRRAAVARAEKRREDAAKAKAKLVFEQCAGMGTSAKLAKLKMITHGSKVPFRFPDL